MGEDRCVQAVNCRFFRDALAGIKEQSSCRTPPLGLSAEVSPAALRT